MICKWKEKYYTQKSNKFVIIWILNKMLNSENKVVLKNNIKTFIYESWSSRMQKILIFLESKFPNS